MGEAGCNTSPPPSSMTDVASSEADNDVERHRTAGSQVAGDAAHPRPTGPGMACWRHGPASPAASARAHPVLRRSPPSTPSRNCPAETATRSCVKSGRRRVFTSRSADAHRSSVASNDAPAMPRPPTHGGAASRRLPRNASVMLGVARPRRPHLPDQAQQRLCRAAAGSRPTHRPQARTRCQARGAGARQRGHSHPRGEPCRPGRAAALADGGVAAEVRA